MLRNRGSSAIQRAALLPDDNDGLNWAKPGMSGTAPSPATPLRVPVTSWDYGRLDDRRS